MELDEKEKIEQVIINSYINGIHGNQDEENIRIGFHYDFEMNVLKDDEVEKVSIDKWLRRIEKAKKEKPELWKEKTRYTISIEHYNYAANAKIFLYKGETHFSTDFMLLYKFPDGWKIISKIYSSPQL